MSTLTDRIPGLEEAASADGMPTVYAEREGLAETALAIRDAGFSVLLDALTVDLLPREPRFEMTYLLLDPGEGGAAPARLRLKVRVPGDDPRVPSVAGVWTAANWAEREAYDFYGIVFDGHPDLRRILMPDDWEGYPMRKDYPVQITERVKTYEPMQVTAEEFAANLQAARHRSTP
jgi:NADH-quinone oxidoreductase subunit C